MLNLKPLMQKHPLSIFWSAVFVVGALTAWSNSLTTTADLLRNDVWFKPWHPYVWEFSSFVSIYVLYFAVFKLARARPLIGPNWLAHLAWHLLASVVFSLLHVALMVVLRQGVYSLMGASYDFGDWWGEWIYEYRKDVVSYFVFVLLLAGFDRWLTDKNDTTQPKTIKIKNKNGVVWLKEGDVVTVESGGNYVYFHANDQVIPMRSTMAEVIKSLDSALFLRVHRSYIVNLSHSQGLVKASSDSHELLLNNGKRIPVSKAFRPALKVALERKLS